jgi:multidrug efflux pump subunit AcrA (membrane-fusion protein)
MIQLSSVNKPAPDTSPTGGAAPTSLNAQEAKGEARQRRGFSTLAIGGLAALVLLGSLVGATLPRLRRQKELDAAALQLAESPPRVSVATARRAPAASEQVLPGNALAFREAALYARTNGYVKRWLADIGDRARRPSRLSALQQQVALQQQQNAVQTAVQQTTFLLQSASQQNGMPQQADLPILINFQLQQSALQIALQQTTALQQASYGRDSSQGQTALRSLNALQTALQQTIALEGALPAQNGQLTPFQLQTLSQEQISLMGLLTSPPSVPRSMSRK